MPAAPAALQWSPVIPVKRLAGAKTRLGTFAGPHHADLALAMTCDTVMAAVQCQRTRAVVVVTDDERAARAVRELGARVVPDVPAAGLNPALVHGAAEAALQHPDAGVCALSADLPALRPDQLDRALRAAGDHERSFLADAPGSGTVLYAAAPGSEFIPAFEGASRSRHREAGATELVLDGVASVRRDVDTVADLRAAVELGIGPHTAKVLAALEI
ncbi:2-phospho-L-lactate guanylyltransferase [Lipingzhangella halophila]|uniref:Phosphoenolpyruvate guanylyltransferase n=1 Tax=Lipingzhangella halophila TaxID=1783352 RepID=A0A7W7RKF5_9ACTN|nr:2-phospho-L-lactate guanylyltransferase [Lipingzhangella halophila]MBB4933591.1 2-phospho-L-lactate guanylyltransferase [Lipingzhangella halophila]